MWTEYTSDGTNYRYWLTGTGRSKVRKLIEEEKARLFEIKTLWITKLIPPVLVALIGIIGALTGFVAVLRHRP